MAKAEKVRLDKLLLDRDLCTSRAQAQGLILSGQVTVGEQKVDKPGFLCPPDAVIHVKTMPRYVSRGGQKLEKALTAFTPNLTDRVVLDVGASTGGFTDCLLQHGAAFVHAVDVGYGQLDWKLRQDERVGVLEKTHITHLPPEQLQPAPSMATIDVSFISLKKVLPNTIACLQSWAGGPREVIALVKPQFEFADYCTRKGFQGVVTHAEDRKTILLGLHQDLQTLLPDWVVLNAAESPIQGPKGNHEFLFHLVESAALSDAERETAASLSSHLEALAVHVS